MQEEKRMAGKKEKEVLQKEKEACYANRRIQRNEIQLKEGEKEQGGQPQFTKHRRDTIRNAQAWL